MLSLQEFKQEDKGEVREGRIVKDIPAKANISFTILQWNLVGAQSFVNWEIQKFREESKFHHEEEQAMIESA